MLDGWRLQEYQVRVKVRASADGIHTPHRYTFGARIQSVVSCSPAVATFPENCNPPLKR